MKYAIIAASLFLSASASAETVLNCGPSMQLQQGSGTVKVCTVTQVKK